MPQLIAMIIVVVGAMIYMFQTFGGTGDKIEGIAQKTSVITEINNIKNGIKLAARAGDIKTEKIKVPGYDTDGTPTGTDVDADPGLKALASLKYFAEQINEQINSRTIEGKPDDVSNSVWLANVYNAISFGGAKNEAGGMIISLVADNKEKIPGIYVNFNFTGSKLKESAGFLESQIASDLKDIAFIDRKAKTPKGSSTARNSSGTAIEQRTPADNGETGTDSDGQFIIYFKDFGSNEVVQ